MTRIEAAELLRQYAPGTPIAADPVAQLNDLLERRGDDLALEVESDALLIIRLTPTFDQVELARVA